MTRKRTPDSEPRGRPAPDEEAVEDEVREQVEELLAERDRLRSERDRKHELHLRARADLENLRKRAARERPQAAAAAKRDLVAALLPALDALDLAVKHGQQGSEPGALLKGLKAARDAIQGALAAQGVERIPADGSYDPELHQADAVVETAEFPDGSIVEELRPGYRVGGLVARHSSVLVAKRPAEQQKPPGEEAEE